MSEPLTPQEEATLREDLTHALTVMYGTRNVVERLLATLDAARREQDELRAARIAALALDPAYEALLRENDQLRREQDALREALVTTLRRDDLCDETDGEHHTDEYVAAFLISLDVELQGRAALAAAGKSDDS